MLQPIDTVYPGFTSEVRRFLTSADSYARLELDLDGQPATITVKPDGDKYALEHSEYALLRARWDIEAPNHLILHIDASKGFSEDTLRFDDLTIAENDGRGLAEAIARLTREEHSTRAQIAAQ